MKKIIFISYSFFVFIFLSLTVYATSGACSWHDGVNCGAGADVDGSVICNDGWTDSSVDYDSMSECADTGLTFDQTSYLFYYHSIDGEQCLEWPEMYNEQVFGCNELLEDGWAGMAPLSCEEQQENLENSGLYALTAGYAEALFGPEEKAYMTKCSVCYERDENYYLILKDDLTECSAIESNEDYLSEITGVTFDDFVDSNICPDNSSLGSDNFCYCDEGYVVDENKDLCITMNDWCKDIYGDHSYADASECFCEEGYIFSTELEICIAEGLETDSNINILGDGNLNFLPFSDLNNSKNKDAIVYLYNNGIIDGYDNGTFKPENSINRAELLKILIKGQGISPSVDKYKNCFFDVKEDWYAPYVCYAKAVAWIDGYSDGTFKPDQTVNKAEAIKMLLNSFTVNIFSDNASPFEDVNVDEWYAPYVYTAKTLGILEETGTLFSPDEGMTRAGICENLYRLLLYINKG